MKNRWLSLLFGLSVSFFGSASYAAIDLKSWKNYSNLAEQGAICASFAALMESQSLLNENMGKLWQERRKFSGAVIGKAVMLEFEKDIASKDIEAFSLTGGAPRAIFVLNLFEKQAPSVDGLLDVFNGRSISKSSTIGFLGNQ